MKKKKKVFCNVLIYNYEINKGIVSGEEILRSSI